MAATPGSYRCMACGLVFDSEDEAKRHEEQHPGMVRRATGETGAILAKGVVTAKKGSADDLMRRPRPP